MEDFSTLGLPEPLMHTLAAMEFNTPTPIQAQAIPAALEGRDILGSAQTGTGKTGAFGIPLVAKLMNNSRGSALVMTPTRELATQVAEQLKSFLGKRSSIKTALMIGGESIVKQQQQLRQRPRLLVGTPGRINDHLERGSLMLHDASFLVLDETDRMLDMGFTDQIEAVMKFMPVKRQTLLFSATLPNNIVRIAQRYLNDPIQVEADAMSSVAENIDQQVRHLGEKEKYEVLCEELTKREGSIIIFMKTKINTDKMVTRIRKQGFKAEAIHGDLRQSKRDRVISQFRDKQFRILVATDVAARGLDIPHIEHVINYDLPQAAEDYIHRIGRTARAGAKGESLCFVTPSDKIKWREIERLLDPNAKRASVNDYPKGGGGGRKGGGGGGRSGKPGGGKPRSGGDSYRPRKLSSPNAKKSFGDKKKREDGDSGERKERTDRTEGGERKPFKQRRDAKPGNGGKPNQRRERSDEGGNNPPKRPSKLSSPKKPSEARGKEERASEGGNPRKRTGGAGKKPFAKRAEGGGDKRRDGGPKRNNNNAKGGKPRSGGDRKPK